MRTEKTISFRVEPSNKLYRAFPIDMLRYDGAHPRRESESHKIEATFNPDVRRSELAAKPGALEIELVGTHNGCPTEGRWQSFGWHVTHVNINGDWEAYHGQRLVK